MYLFGCFLGKNLKSDKLCFDCAGASGLHVGPSRRAPFSSLLGVCFLEVLRRVAFFVDWGSIWGSFWEGFGVPNGHFGASLFEVDLERPKGRPKTPKGRVLCTTFENKCVARVGPAECAGVPRLLISGIS